MSDFQDLRELKKSHSGLEIIQLEVQNDESIKQAFDHVSKLLGSEGLHLLINNSAILEKVGSFVGTRKSAISPF